MATSAIGLGNGKYIAGLAVLRTENSGDILNYTPAVVQFKNGDRLSIPLFSCETENDLIDSVKSITKIS